MAKEQYWATASYDELDPEDAQDRQRRMLIYSPAALRAGASVDRIVVQHSRVTDTLNSLDRIFQLSREYEMPQGGILVGPAGSGRRTVSRLFEERLPKSDLFAPGYGCIRISLGTIPTVAAIVARLLRRFSYPFSRGSDTQMEMRREIVAEQIQAKGTRLLIVTTAQSMLTSTRSGRTGSGRTSAAHERALDFLCELQDATRVAVVLAGDERVDALRDCSAELTARLPVRMELTNFAAADATWAGLLAAFNKSLLDQTGIDLGIDHSNVRQVRVLHTATKGNPRELKRLLTETVIISSEARRKRATAVDFENAFAAIRGPAHKGVNPMSAATPKAGKEAQDA